MQESNSKHGQISSQHSNNNNITNKSVQYFSSQNKKKSGKKSHKKNKSKTNQFDQLDMYYEQKACQICSLDDNDHQLLLCDRCDDAYHAKCIGLLKIPQKDWICSQCIKDIKKQRKKQKQQQQQQEKNKQQIECFKCKQKCSKSIFIPTYLSNINQQIIQQYDQFQILKCMTCQNMFHQICFSVRKNSLNCSQCQRMIRENGPKGHSAFMKFLKQQNKRLIQNGLQKIPEKKTIQQQKQKQKQKTSKNRSKYKGLQLSLPLSDTIKIIQYQASLYYALQTKKVIFTNDNVYLKEKTDIGALLQPSKNQQEIKFLDERDQKIYQTYLENIKKYIVIPIQIKQDRVKGFYAVTTDFIQKDTILTEYVGEVVNARDALLQLGNDCIMVMLRTPRSKTSLDVAAMQYGNIARFFSGINNHNKNYAKLENVNTFRFLYKGTIRIIFTAMKNIQRGEILYINYNTKQFQEFPTQNFTA